MCVQLRLFASVFFLKISEINEETSIDNEELCQMQEEWLAPTRTQET